MPRPTLEFWFEFASTYSYPAAMRIEDAAGVAGVDIVWRPFLLGPIFKAQLGLGDSPFKLVPAKDAYMWRDLERVCTRHGFAFRRPSLFPRNSLKAARLAIVAAGEDWLPDFVRAVYVANFVRDLDVADPGILAACVIEAGGDPRTALAATELPATKQSLRDATEEAERKGLFGAPSFVTEDGELFWGNDRLDDAIAWAVRRAE